MNLKIYLGMLRKAEQTLAESFRQVAAGHAAEPDVHFLCHTLATQCEEHSRLLLPVVQRYGEDRSDNEPERIHAATGPWACCATSRTSISWRASSMSPGPWSNRPARRSATGNSLTSCPAATAKQPSSCAGCRPG